MIKFIVTKMMDEASAKIRIKDYEGAKDLYTTIININSKNNLISQNELPIFYRGVVKIKLKDYKDSINDFSQVIKINNANDEAYFFRAIAKENLGNDDSALIDYSTSINLNPLEKTYKNELIRIKKKIHQNHSAFIKDTQNITTETKSRSFNTKPVEIVNESKKKLKKGIYKNKNIKKLDDEIKNKPLNQFQQEVSSKERISKNNKVQKLYTSNTSIESKKEQQDLSKEVKHYNSISKNEKKVKNGIFNNISFKNSFLLFLFTFFPFIFFRQVVDNSFQGINENISNNYNFPISKGEPLSEKDHINLFNYAKSFLEDKDYLSSKYYFSRLIESDPNNTFALNMRGLSQYKLKDYSGAINDFSKAINLDNKFMLAYNNRGISKISLKNYQGAIADFTQAIALKNNYVNGYINRGTAHYKLGNFKESLYDFDKAIEINPKDSAIYIGRSIVKQKINDIKGACTDLEVAIKLSSIDMIEKNWYKRNCVNQNF